MRPPSGSTNASASSAKAPSSKGRRWAPEIVSLPPGILLCIAKPTLDSPGFAWQSKSLASELSRQRGGYTVRSGFRDLDRILRGDATRTSELRRGTIEVPVVGLALVV